jgi:hypothetical protein
VNHDHTLGGGGCLTTWLYGKVQCGRLEHSLYASGGTASVLALVSVYNVL